MGRKRGLLLGLIGLVAIGVFGWIARPQPCDHYVDGRLNAYTWAANVIARISGSEEDCDPWSSNATDELTGPIALSFSINAYAGPITQNYLISPNGTVEIWPEIWFLPDDGRASRDYSYSFRDPAIFELANERLAPLRSWSHPLPEAEWLEQTPPTKYQLECGNNGYHSAIRLFWDGNFELADAAGEASSDISYFENSLQEICPAAAAAHRRFYAVMDAINRQVPADVYEGWFELEARLSEEFRQQSAS